MVIILGSLSFLAGRHQWALRHSRRHGISVARHQHRDSRKIKEESLLFHTRRRRRLKSHLRHLRCRRTTWQQQIREDFPLLSSKALQLQSVTWFRQIRVLAGTCLMTKRRRFLSTGCSTARPARTVANNGCDKFIGGSTKTNFAIRIVASGQQAGLKLGKLSHEVEIWWDQRSTALEVVVGIVKSHSTGVDEVCNADGCRTTDASATVDENFTTGLSNALCAQYTACHHQPVTINTATTKQQQQH